MMKDAADQIAALTERIHRACLTVAHDRAVGPRGFFSTWPAYRLDWWDAEDFGDQRTDEAITKRLIRPPRFVASAKEIDDALPALQLLAGLEKRHWQVVALKALQGWYGVHLTVDDPAFGVLGRGWRGIGRELNCSHTTAINLHRDAMAHAYARSVQLQSKGKNPLSKSLA